MPKNIVILPNSPIPMSIFQFNNVPKMVTKISFDFDCDQRIKTPVSTRRMSSIIQQKSWVGIVRVSQELEQSDVVPTFLQLFGFLVMDDIELQQIDSHLRRILTISTTQTIFLTLNLHPMMKKIIIFIH
jgi:hypothetical protein